MSPTPRINVFLALLASLVLLALLSLPFLRIAPNRLVSGEAAYFFSLLALWSGWLATVPCTWLLAAVIKPSQLRLMWVGLSAAAWPLGLLWLAANQAGLSSPGESSIARVSLGAAFWIAILLSALIASDALQRLQATPLQKAVLGVVLAATVWVMLASGLCDNLSIMKEYANRADGFAGVVLRHAQIVGLAMAFALALGVTLGWAAYAHQRIANIVFPVLNVVQTIPSIALFGLLMAPLAWLAARWPAIGAAGISGVGLAPAVIALTLYGLLPVVRATLAGLQQVSGAQINAARALGLTPVAVLRHVAVPLALPVIMGGVRTAAVAAVGLAAVTALIGAGGLGSIMFDGLFSSAQDVVLLGVLPLIALGVMVDAVFRLLISMAVRQARPHG